MELGTNVNGVELADTRYEPFPAKAEALNAIFFLHPIGFTDTRRLTPHFLTNVIGNPLDTTVALAHVVFGGVLYKPVEFVNGARSLTRAQKDAIIGGTAAKLLGLKAKKNRRAK